MSLPYHEDHPLAGALEQMPCRGMGLAANRSQEQTVARRTEILIGLAVQTCLAQCCASSSPFVCLTDFMDELRDRGWNEESVSAVELGVVKSLCVSLSQT